MPSTTRGTTGRSWVTRNDWSRRIPTGVARFFLARALAALDRGDEALTHLDTSLRLPTDVSARVQTGIPPTFIVLLGAMELSLHGDTTNARIAAEHAVQWFDSQPREAVSGRYDWYYPGRLLAFLRRYDEAAAAIAPRAPADSVEPLYLGLEGALAALRGATQAAREADGKLAAMTDPVIASVTPRSAGASRCRSAIGKERSHCSNGRGREAWRVATGMDMHLDWLYDPLRGDPRFERINRGRD